LTGFPALDCALATEWLPQTAPVTNRQTAAMAKRICVVNFMAAPFGKRLRMEKRTLVAGMSQ
jgi:hypothetical protein